MKQPYPNMTGEKLLNKVSSRALIKILLNSLLLIFLAMFFLYLIFDGVREMPESLVMLFTLPLWILLFYFPIKAIRTHLVQFRSGGCNEVFRRYGTPDEIAEVLADPENVQLIRSSNIIVTKAYLMKKGDFLSYLPLSEIVYIEISRTHGRHAHIVMNVQPKEEPFRRYSVSMTVITLSLDRQMEMLAEDLKDQLQIFAPDCHVRHSAR